MTSNPAVRQVAPFLLAAAAAAVYTYTGNKNGFSVVGFMSVCNNDVATRYVIVSVVPAGGTLSASTYRIINSMSLLSTQSKFLVSDSDDTGLGNLVLRDGDQLVVYADAANVVSARITMIEHNAG